MEDSCSTQGSTQDIEFKDLIRVPMFVLGIFAQILCFGCVAFGQPTLALHLNTYAGFSQAWIGFYFAAPAITYIISSLMISPYCKLTSRKNVILIGSFLFAVSFYLLASSPMLGITDSSYIILAGLLLLGFSS